jgi:hypothetical protein
MNRKRKTWFVLAVAIVGMLGLAALVTAPAEAFFNCKIVSCACPACGTMNTFRHRPDSVVVCVPN